MKQDAFFFINTRFLVFGTNDNELTIGDLVLQSRLNFLPGVRSFVVGYDKNDTLRKYKLHSKESFFDWAPS